MHSSPIVIKIGGTALEDRSSAPMVWTAVAKLHTQHPGGVVLLHGGGKAVDRHLDRLGFTTERRDGIRITPSEQIEEITAVLAGKINKSIVQQLNTLGINAVGLCLGDGAMLKTVKSTKYAFDPGRVGEVIADPSRKSELLPLLLTAGFLPVLSSIGMDELGFLNLNADDAAAGIAASLGAKALVLLTDVPGIFDETKTVAREMDSDRIESLVASGHIVGGMIVKARAAAATAISTGVPVVILSGNDPSAIGDWASGKPVGTRILSTPPKVGSAT
jgi:acetylglutamate kinase